MDGATFVNLRAGRRFAAISSLFSDVANRLRRLTGRLSGLGRVSRLSRRTGRRLDSAGSERRARGLTENWAHRLRILQLPPMSFAEIPAEVDGFGTGEVGLVGPEVLRELLRSADDDGYLSVVLEPTRAGAAR